MRAALVLMIVSLVPVLSTAQAPAPKTLDIYVIDVEGGTAMLFVSPTGESMLIDSGGLPNTLEDPRDAGRIMEAVKAAGIQKIDHMMTTHYDYDHYAGLPELASRIKIEEFIDHGPNTQHNEQADRFMRDIYPKLYANAKHTVVKPGDKISLAGADVTVTTSAGEHINTPLPAGGKPNPYCASFQTARSNTEDQSAITAYITYGKFRAFNSGDIPVTKEFELMCPNAMVGPVDLLLSLHHGTANSNSPVLIHALHPRVAIMNNGTRKGGNPEVMQTVFSSPGLEDLWQMHFSSLSGQEYTVPGLFIANMVDDQPSSMPIAPAPAAGRGANQPSPNLGGVFGGALHEGKAYWFKVSARQDGSFTVTNTRNGFSKTYEALP